MFNIYRTGIVVTCGLIFLGWGCAKPAPHDPVNRPADVSAPTSTIEEGDSVVSSSVDSRPTSPTVSRTFTLEEIEAEGGLKNWFRDLARANVAGKKTLVRIPVNRIFAFGCETPTSYCASTQTTGCFGPYLDLKGEINQINQANEQCDQVCNQELDFQDLAADAMSCSSEFRDSQCSTLWGVEGYVTAASRVPEVSEEEGGSCGQGELIYDFNVTRVIKKIANGYDEEFEFVEYK